jgi:hypothetical protein
MQPALNHNCTGPAALGTPTPQQSQDLNRVNCTPRAFRGTNFQFRAELQVPNSSFVLQTNSDSVEVCRAGSKVHKTTQARKRNSEVAEETFGARKGG